MPAYIYTFISHAHADNALCDPWNDALTRHGVPHYYDRQNPQIGHDIGQALQAELQQARALIVLASPASLTSPWVKEEISIFHTLMMKDPSRLLIPVKVAECELPPMLEARWWLDATGRPVEDVITLILRALEAQQNTAQNPGHAAGAGQVVRTVDWRHGSGNHKTIASAIAAAQPGERILIRKGVYDEALVIDKPLELVGDGQPGDVEIHATGGNVISFSARQGLLSNLTLRQDGEEGQGLDIAAGRLEVAGCDIGCAAYFCIWIHDEADPRIHHCRVHDSVKSSGIGTQSQGKGMIEDCEIFGNAFCGVQVSEERSSVTIRRCRIHHNQTMGVYVDKQARCVVEDCDIYENSSNQLEAVLRGTLTARNCRIRAGKASGVWIHSQGQGAIENCDISAHEYYGIVVEDDQSDSSIRSCKLHDNLYMGIAFLSHGRGDVQDSEMFGNSLSGMSIGKESTAVAQRNRFHDNKENGIIVWEKGQGVIDNNEIIGNDLNGLSVMSGGTPTVRRNRIIRSKGFGVRISEKSGGIYERNELRENISGAWFIGDDCKDMVTLRDNIEG